MHPRLLDAMLEQAVASGGCIKFDLKAWDPVLHRVLTGVSNERPLANFARAADWIARRPVPPVLAASTLMVPGYLDVREIQGLARFIASLNSSIPYSLLAFHPQFRMADLPVTSKALAEQCLAAARGAGLQRLRIGNLHLLK
jgi:pyruvate formate lyase activating enzyme